MSITPTNPGPTKAEQFMSSPLVAWLKTFDQTMTIETVHDLSNGVLMNKVMYTVDPNAYSMSKVHRTVTLDMALCIQNLQLLVQRIKHFYLTSVQQLVICNLPNISSICYDPGSDYSLDQLERLLILLLGCGIQCESKGPIIEKMKSMDLAQQQSLVLHIQQVTESTDFVCSIDWNDLEEISKQNLEGLCRTAYIHLQRVAKERDHQYDHIVEVLLERDYYKSLHDSQNPNISLPRENGLPVPLNSPLKSPSINPEIIELKKKCRTLQEKLDSKLETLSDLRDEMDRARATVKQLQQEKRELAEDAKSVRVYRDEVEALRVQSAKVGKLEAEVVKYRQKAEDTDYLKKRIKDLQGQNDLMSQTKKLLEQKATSLTAKTESMDELQEMLASLKVRVESMEEEKEMDMERIEELLANNTRLEMDVRHYEEKLALMSSELETVKEAGVNSSAGEASNLSFELTEADLASKAKVLRLEKETREMEKTVEALRHAQAKGAELEKTNKKLHTQTHSDRKEIIKLKEENEVLKVKASRVDKLQVELNTQRERLEEANRFAPKLKNVKSRNEGLLEAKAKLEDEVESLQSKVSLMNNLQDENASLKAQLDSQNSELAEDQKRLQEILEQNAQLELEKQKETEEVEAVRAQLLQLQTRSSHSAHVTVLSPPRVSEAEMASRAKLQRLEKETREMEKSIEALRHFQAKCAEYEKMNKKLQAQTHTARKEIIRLKEELQGNRAKVSRLELLQSEMRSQEHQLEDIDGASKKITELRQQNALLSETKILLEEELTGLHNKLDRLGELQADNAALKVRVESLESENKEEGLRMQELLQQNAQLEMIRDSKSVEIEALHSNIAKLKLKQASEETDSAAQQPSAEIDLATQTKLLRLERDNRELERSLQTLKQSSERVNAEVEKTNKKLTAQIHADKKEIARLKEELRKERSQHARLSRISSVGDEQDLQEAKQLQELESKFKDFYSQSLSNKDDRIKVLDNRIEEMTEENAQLRQEIKDIRKHIDKLKERSTDGSPRASPGMSRTYSPREMNRLKEQASDAMRLRDKYHSLQDESNHLAGDLMEAKHIIQQHESHNQRLNDRIQMLEQLNHTLEEEKKTLLLQVNKMLEKNQDLLVKTLENKDQAFEEERMFSDRLGELERDKARLTEQLISHQREQLSKEMDLWKKSKSKNLLKKGFKKLKGKISGRSHTFEVPEGGALGGSSNTLNSGSMGSPSGSAAMLGLPPYHLDGTMSQSSQSISSSNSGRHSEDQEELDLDPSLVPRAPTMDGSPFLRPRKTRSYTLPGMGAVKMRHAHATNSPSIQPERPDNLITLEDFLAESEKTPNKRRVMELQRASLIINTPPSTPRNSLLLPVPPPSSSSNSSQMFDLQEFLSKFDPGDSPGVIPEDEEVQQISSVPSREFRSSQQSMSQRSKSSSSLHSAQSQTSISSKNVEGGPVIINPAANANFNNNNRSQEAIPGVFYSHNSTTGSVTLVDGHAHDGPSSSTPNGESNSTISWKDTSGISPQNYVNVRHSSYSDARSNTSPSGHLSVNEGTRFVTLNDTRGRSSTMAAGISRSRSSDALKKEASKPKSKGRGLFKKHFHRSTGELLDDSESKSKSKSGKPPVGGRKKNKDSSGKNKSGNKGEKKKSSSMSSTSLEVPCTSERRSSIPNLSALTDLSQTSERTDNTYTPQKNGKSTKRLSLPVWSLTASSENIHLAGQDPFSKAGETNSLSQPANVSMPNSSISEEESIWQEYGSV